MHSLCPRCRSKSIVSTASNSKPRLAGKVTNFREWDLSCTELFRMTIGVAWSRRGRDAVAVATLNLSVMSSYQLRFGFQGWLPDLRVDKITLGLHHLVPIDDPFMKACRSGDLNMARKLLIDCPACPSYVDPCERTPLSRAIKGGHYDICRYLLDNGAKVDSIFGKYQTSALSLAIALKDIAIASLLV